jgi:hypothetical protein
MQLAQTQVVIAKHIPHTFIEREGIPHLVYIERGIDFKKTPGGSQGHFIDMLIREGLLRYLFS